MLLPRYDWIQCVKRGLKGAAQWSRARHTLRSLAPPSAAAPNEPYNGMYDPWKGKKLLRCRCFVLENGHRGQL